MRVFLTGATGFIGSRIVGELLAAGHEVIGVTRSDSGAEKLTAAGATPYRATLEEPAGLAAGAAEADAVIHTAFDHDFSRFVENCEKDRRVILALGEVLAGSDRPLIITSGVGIGGGTPGVSASEDVFDRDHPNPRIASELAGQEVAQRGVDVRVVRLPQVHDTHLQGLVSPLIDVAREKVVSHYVGDGANLWPAAHVDAVARLYRLALERGAAGQRYHAVDEEGVSARDIATAIGAGLGIPVKSIAPDEVEKAFGPPFSGFVALDMPASSALTRERLGWEPSGPGLLEDLAAMDWSRAGWAAQA